jgi:hypothetical protein
VGSRRASLRPGPATVAVTCVAVLGITAAEYTARFCRLMSRSTAGDPRASARAGNLKKIKPRREIGRIAAVVGRRRRAAIHPEARKTAAIAPPAAKWPFEIGLWVGRGAMPNRMGAVGNNDERTARVQVMRYARDSSSFPPIPIDFLPVVRRKAET